MRFPITSISVAAALAFAGVAVAAGPPGSGVSGELESSRLAAPAVSADEVRACQVRAAEAHAMDQLRETVLRLEVGRGLHVRDLVDRTNAAEGLNGAMAAARPLGGPRWVDEQTCQMQVTIAGIAIADAVAAMAARYPSGRLPIRSADLNARLAQWRATAFTATGSSVAGQGAQRAAPRDTAGKWSAIPDSVRRQAVAAAQADAVGRTMHDLARAVANLPLGGSAQPAGAATAFARPRVDRQVRAYLGGQPVTNIDFLADLSVAVTVTVDGRALAGVVQRAVVDDQPRTTADHRGEWDAIRSALERAVAPTVTGTASVAGPPPAGTVLPSVVLPVAPPDEFDGLLETEGSATAPTGGRTGRLKVKGMADADAVAKLRERLLRLRVAGATTLAEAARSDPLLSAAVSRALLDVHDDKIEFSSDGSSVRVHAHLDLRDAWEQLRANR